MLELAPVSASSAAVPLVETPVPTAAPATVTLEVTVWPEAPVAVRV
jgi:hypothetical protein